jgi:cytochrome c oxidase assembly protein subunit 15
MGCPDWPTCFGAALPPGGLGAAELPAWIEMIHRYGAVVVSLLVAATAALAWRWRQVGAPWRPALAALAIVALQVFLGAVTVWQRNAPWTVSAHLAAALALLAATTATAVWAVPRGSGALARARPRGAEAALLGATATLALVGSVVQTTGGGWSCPDLPLCRGELWPAALGLPATSHMLHRVLALLVAGLLARVAWRGWTTGAGRGPLLAAVGLFGLQVAVGLAQVLAGMPAEARLLHLVLAAAFWVAAVALALEVALTRRSPVGDAADSGDRRPAWAAAPQATKGS